MAWKILQGHVLDKLAEIETESVHTCITSPPYWGLRDYGVPPTVWGGDSNCEHEWGSERIAPCGNMPSENTSKLRGGKGIKKGEKYHRDNETMASRSQFCCRCGAWSGCYGLEPTVDLYVQNTVTVFREVRRVLRNDGTLWLNIGDSYAGGGRAGTNPEYHRRHKMFGKAGWDPGKFGVPLSIPEGIKAKDMVGVPWAVAFALRADGWWLRSDIIWAKPNPMPESVTDRPTKSHEYIFLFAKSGAPQYWLHRDLPGVRKRPESDTRWINQVSGEEVKTVPRDRKKTVKCPDCGGTGKIMANSPYDFFGETIENPTEEECGKCRGRKKIVLWKRANLWRGRDYYYDIEAIKEDSTDPESYAGRRKRNPDKFTGQRFSETRSGFSKLDGEKYPRRNKRTVWTITTQPYSGAHFAVFPAKLIEPCVLAGTSPRACEICGAPWERVVSKKILNQEGWGKAKKDHMGNISGPQSTIRNGHGRAGDTVSKTLYWQPTCSCDNEGKGRCVVLDPFAGSGTSLYVAELNGRDSIGIEISSKYCELINKRMKRFRISII